MVNVHDSLLAFVDDSEEAMDIIKNNFGDQSANIHGNMQK